MKRIVLFSLSILALMFGACEQHPIPGEQKKPENAEKHEAAKPGH